VYRSRAANGVPANVLPSSTPRNHVTPVPLNEHGQIFFDSSSMTFVRQSPETVETLFMVIL
jgi:hypothetical protein